MKFNQRNLVSHAIILIWAGCIGVICILGFSLLDGFDFDEILLGCLFLFCGFIVFMGILEIVAKRAYKDIDR